MYIRNQLTWCLLLACIFLTDLTAGLPAAAAEEKPAPFEVVSPVYRNTIYSTEKSPSIKIRLTALKPTAGESVTATLQSQSGKELASLQVKHPSDLVTFDASRLEPGQYVVILSQGNSSGIKKEVGKVNIFKAPPSPGSEVRIDEHRNLIVDGKPSIQIGWYGEARLDDPRKDVQALQNVQTAVVVMYPDKSEVARRFREYGIRTMVNMEPARHLYSFGLWRTPDHPIPNEHKKLAAPSPECRELVAKMIELLKDEPGLLGWYISDEPEINDVRADYLEAYYQMFRELDPYHPVVVTNDTIDGIEKIGYRCCDILAPDPYGDKPDYVPSFLAKALSVMKRGQGLVLTPWHSAHHTHFSAEYGTAPPFAFRVMRGQYLATLAAGGRGFIGYTEDFFLPEPRLRIGLPHIWRETRFLEPFFETCGPAHLTEQDPANQLTLRDTTGGKDLQNCFSWIGRSGQHLALIVMNGSNTPRKFEVKHPDLTMNRLAVISEGREVSVRNQAFTDTVPPGEASVYSNSPNGLQLPTVKQTEQQIVEFEKSSALPGNLFHTSQGTKVRASAGIVPWYSQPYYYVANGVTDDAGWHVSHAELPQWVEISLPSEKSIQRLVVYSPNLKDYNLQFRSAAGVVYQAEVRGNQSDRTEHVLANPVTTLRLRLVALAVRDNAKPPRCMVREIEAYADLNTSATPKLPLVKIDAPQESESNIPVAQNKEPPLWSEDFSSVGLPKSDWLADPKNVQVEFDASRRILKGTSIASGGYASIAKVFPHSPDYRYLQIDATKVEGDGYRWLTVVYGDPHGKFQALQGVQTMKPGRYTVDIHALHENFRSAETKHALFALYMSNKIDYEFSSAAVVKQPIDGLLVTLADGSPLPRSLKPDQEILLRLYLQKPAADAVVELYRDSSYLPTRVNGEPYVQLLKSGKDKDGRYWSAVVKLGPKTDKFKLNGYPVLFRAVIHGNPLKETLATIMVDFE